MFKLFLQQKRLYLATSYWSNRFAGGNANVVNADSSSLTEQCPQLSIVDIQPQSTAENVNVICESATDNASPRPNAAEVTY